MAAQGNFSADHHSNHVTPGVVALSTRGAAPGGENGRGCADGPAADPRGRQSVIMASAAEERAWLRQQIEQTREDVSKTKAELASVREKIDEEQKKAETERIPGLLEDWKSQRDQLQTELGQLHIELQNFQTQYAALTPGMILWVVMLFVRHLVSLFLRCGRSLML